MTALAEDLDLQVFEDLMDDEDMPCAYTNDNGTPCDRPAMWTAITIPCGHDARCCNYHRLKELSIVKSGIGVWCGISNVEITDIEFQPLG